MQKIGKKVILIILDGWGLSPIEEGNAPLLASTPTLDACYANYPKTSLSASGLEVGLHRGEMGNSEVGHTNLGTGRVIWESLPKIDQAIEEGVLAKNQNLINLFKQTEGKVHLIGLTSSGGVHSHLGHLFALIKIAKQYGKKDLCIHFISDGRDTAPQAGVRIAEELEGEVRKIGVGRVVSLVGRYYAMDRDLRWDRTERAYKLITKGVGKEFNSLKEAIEDNYKKGEDDEFIEPSIIDKSGLVKPGDAIIFYNFRADRVRQIARAFFDSQFSGFKREKIKNLTGIAMTEYWADIKIPIIFKSEPIKSALAEVLEKSNLSQIHIAESEKYPHVTYFFNGGLEKPHRGEIQQVVSSPKVSRYDKKPAMSAFQVTKKVIAAIDKNFDFILINFANGDMVGHTGNLEATKEACQVVDNCLKKIFSKADGAYKILITADHGNCEIMINLKNGQPNKEHTTSPVPFLYLDLISNSFDNVKGRKTSNQNLVRYFSMPATGVIADVTPTILTLLNLQIPDQINKINLVNDI